MCSILKIVRMHFSAAGGEEFPPLARPKPRGEGGRKIRKGGGAAPLTISSFSLAEYKFECAKHAQTNY